MSQNDFSIANQTFPNTRADINDALQALASLSSGSTAPSTTYANMLWYDASNNILKMRTEADDAWINLAYLDQSSDAFRILDDTQVVNTSGTQTGLLGDQTTATWEDGTGTTESLVSPAKIASAISALAGGGFTSVQVFTASGTWTRPVGVTKVLVFVTGGGGGGGGDSSGGSDGGDSSWADGVNTLSASGGGGGGTSSSAYGQGGIGSGNDLNIRGGIGNNGGGGSFWAEGSGNNQRTPSSNSYGAAGTGFSGGDGGGGGTGIGFVDVSAISSSTITVGSGGSKGSGAGTPGDGIQGVVFIMEFK